MVQPQTFSTPSRLNPSPTLTVSSSPLLVHRVQPTETLSQIVANFYDAPYGSSDYQKALTLIQYVNPEITDPNRIYPGQLIRLYDLAQGELAYCPVEEANSWSLAAERYSDKRSEIDTWLDNHALMLPDLEAYQHHMPKDPAEQEAFSLLAWGHQNYGLLSVVGVAGFNTFDGILSLANRAFIAEVNEAWSQYQAGHINKNQYDYRRKKALEAFARKVGPFEKLLFRGKTTKEAIRITRQKAVPATQKIDAQLGRLSRLAKLSKNGGILLSAAGVAVACHQIAHTEDRQKKNEVFIETVGGTVAGAVATVGLGILFAATPVGWVTALALGGAATLGGYAAGKGSVKVYDTYFNQHDLVSLSGVDRICR